ncbi:FAD-dependent oxidoreductase [Halobacillus sp.]|uniref:FAD-dependent oxidoreductase n=1 Tax=Halobacillus sp. TaxID=56800 RepID=UPI003BAEACE1
MAAIGTGRSTSRHRVYSYTRRDFSFLSNYLGRRKNMAHQLPERSFPLWRDQSIESFPVLTENTEADVTVIGAGITGILTAYLLVKKGYSVVILEAGRLWKVPPAILRRKSVLSTDSFMTTLFERSAKKKPNSTMTRIRTHCS